MLIRIVSWIWCVFSIVINRKLVSVSSGGVVFKGFSVISVFLLLMIMLDFCSVMIVRNRLMLVMIVECSDEGMFDISYVCILDSDSIRNIRLEMNIVFSVCCYGRLVVLIMVNVKNVFRFIFGVMFIGKLVVSVIIVEFSVVVR